MSSERGNVDLNDSIFELVPVMPNYGHDVTDTMAPCDLDMDMACDSII